MVTVNYSNFVHKSPWDYPNFKSYWNDEKGYYKLFKCKNIIWRIIHYDSWISRDGSIVWKDFLFYSSPIVPTILKVYCSYKAAIKYFQTIKNEMISELVEDVNRRILDEVFNMNEEELNKLVEECDDDI